MQEESAKEAVLVFLEGVVGELDRDIGARTLCVESINLIDKGEIQGDDGSERGGRQGATLGGAQWGLGGGGMANGG